MTLRFLGFDESGAAAYVLQEVTTGVYEAGEGEWSDWDGKYQVLAVLLRGKTDFSERYLVSDRFYDFRVILRASGRTDACEKSLSWRCLKSKVTGRDAKTDSDIAEAERDAGIRALRPRRMPVGRW